MGDTSFLTHTANPSGVIRIFTNLKHTTYQQQATTNLGLSPLKTHPTRNILPRLKT